MLADWLFLNKRTEAFLNIDGKITGSQLARKVKTTRRSIFDICTEFKECGLINNEDIVASSFIGRKGNMIKLTEKGKKVQEILIKLAGVLNGK